MYKKILISLMPVLLVIFLFGCGRKDIPENDTDNTDYEPKEQIELREETVNEQNRKQCLREEVDMLKSQIAKMTLDEKIGQMIMVGIDDYTNNDHSREMIEKYHVGGFILFKKNIKDAEQTLDLINSLKKTNRENKIPLFISVDEEGGRVTRVPDEFLKIPANRIIGETDNEDFAFEIGGILGRELNALGMNMNFAPVLDINSNKDNPVIGDRSLGSEAEIVSRLGIKIMKGIQSQNVISVVKHFPGHGDTSEDSHIGMPAVHHNLDRLKDFELVPFYQAIQNNADVVMIAHILLPEIDAENPASLSSTIITDILRNDMKFDGVVITDDMTMGAITKNYDIGEAAVKSVNAGSDIILVCHEYSNETAVITALKEAVESGEINEDNIDKSVYRILKLKEKYSLKDDETTSVDIDGINNSIKSVLKKYLNKD